MGVSFVCLIVCLISRIPVNNRLPLSQGTCRWCQTGAHYDTFQNWITIFLNGITLIRFAVLTFDQRVVRGGLETHCLYYSQHGSNCYIGCDCTKIRSHVEIQSLTLYWLNHKIYFTLLYFLFSWTTLCSVLFWMGTRRDSSVGHACEH